MENNRSLKVDVAVNGYRDEDGKYNILSHDVSIPKEQGFKEELDSTTAIAAGVDENGKAILLSEKGINGKSPFLLDMENDESKLKEDTPNSKEIIEVKDISEILSSDLPDETLIRTPKGIEITAGQVRKEAKDFSFENSPLNSKVKSKRVEAIEFLTKKDSVKYDFKALLRDCLKGYDKSVETIRAIYKIRVLNKEFKHLNANSKRIALNDYLSNKFIEHSAETNKSTIDLIALLKNDNNLIDYAVLLKRVLVMAINRNIKLY
jgi:hypothetical protein